MQTAVPNSPLGSRIQREIIHELRRQAATDVPSRWRPMGRATAQALSFSLQFVLHILRLAASVMAMVGAVILCLLAVPLVLLLPVLAISLMVIVAGLLLDGLGLV